MEQREGDAIAWNCLIYAILLFVVLAANSNVTGITVHFESIVRTVLFEYVTMVL